MKNESTLITIAGVLILVLGAVIFWREYRLAANLEALRATVARAGSSPTTTQATPPSLANGTSTHTSTSLPHDVTGLKARIGELERQQQQTAELLNQAIAELNRLIAMAEKAKYRSWGPEQLVGEPDTMTAGDHPTAWAAAQQDAGPEWIQVGYERAVEISQVRVRETDHPGAVTKVTAVFDNGREALIWEGVEQAAPAPYESPFNAPRGIVAGAVRVYLDTSRTPGWEEIDAVELVGTDGTRQWAICASASSTYAAQGQTYRNW